MRVRFVVVFSMSVACAAPSPAEPPIPVVSIDIPVPSAPAPRVKAKTVLHREKNLPNLCETYLFTRIDDPFGERIWYVSEMGFERAVFRLSVNDPRFAVFLAEIHQEGTRSSFFPEIQMLCLERPLGMFQGEPE